MGKTLHRDQQFAQALHDLKTLPAPAQFALAIWFAVRFYPKRQRREWVFASAPARILE